MPFLIAYHFHGKDFFFFFRKARHTYEICAYVSMSCFRGFTRLCKLISMYTRRRKIIYTERITGCVQYVENGRAKSHKFINTYIHAKLCTLCVYFFEACWLTIFITWHSSLVCLFYQSKTRVWWSTARVFLVRIS